METLPPASPGSPQGEEPRIALHLSFWRGRAWLWGERAFPWEEPGPRHPGDAGREGLREVLKRLGAGVRVSLSRVETPWAWLPTRGALPLPSSPLLGEPKGRGTVRLRPHGVTALGLEAGELFDLLAALAEGTPPGIGGDASLAWWGRLAREAANLGIREACLPGLVRGDRGWEARWIPLPDEEAQQALDRLAASLPGVARCLGEGAKTPPETAPRFLAETAAGWLADALGRSGPVPFPPRFPGPRESLHDAWLEALGAPDPVVPWPEEGELEDFAARLDRWRRPLEILARSPLRLVFRLLEPEDGEGRGPWRVEYLLQPRWDPSLLVPLGALWRKEEVPRTLGLGEGEEAFVRLALEQAAPICPEVEASLEDPHPEGFATDLEGAAGFLARGAEALRGAGFPVLLPSWWLGRGEGRRLTLRGVVRTGVAAPTGTSLEDLVALDLQASLGEEVLEPEELEALARAKAPLVRRRGRWFWADREQIETALRFLAARRGEPRTVRDLLEATLGSPRPFGGVELASLEAEGDLGELLRLAAGSAPLPPASQPEGFRGTLRPYQLRGLAWMAFLRRWGLGACLADDMGLGKTAQALALIQRDREEGRTDPVLLVCPTSVIHTWTAEAARFVPDLPLRVHHGPDRPRGRAFVTSLAGAGLVVTSYALLQRDGETLRRVAWGGVILDEAQNVKNPDTAQFRVARSLRAGFRLALTGTPVENHVGDLWSLFEFLNPGLLGGREAFRREFFRPIQVWGDDGAATALRRRTGPFILRRLKTDRSVLPDLPEKVVSREFCTLTVEQASLYRAVLDRGEERVAESQGMTRRGEVLALLTRLKQVCNHPAHFLGDGSPLEGRSGKLARLVELLAQVREQGECALVFSQFAEMGGLLRDYLQRRLGEEVLFLHGGVPRVRRDEMVERFQGEGGPGVFVLSLKAGGTGLTLSRANHVVHYDRWWNPAVEDQATDRAYRIGQRKNVFVHPLIVAGTLEERIDALLESKADLADRVVGAGERWLTELGDRDLHALLALDRNATEE
ncbi:DEAD/DEAH box helicase [Aminomonas paucivorans]|uniref:DEAD/DEAH box helicase n=1 Tax=Aminomonas paucivorans TaxID=81412 RepID=UPI00331CC4CE